MTPFLTSGETFHTRVYDRTGAGYVRSLGTRDAEEAERFEAMLQRFRRQRRWDVLGLIIARRVRVAAVYDADAAGTLAQLVLALVEAERAASALAEDVDLDPLVAEWAPLAHSRTYVQQVRRLIPAGQRFPVSSFTRRRVSEFLARLTHTRNPLRPLDGPTRTRYRVALMQFARWLVEREVLEANPVRDVAGYAANDPRMVHYPRETAQALVAALPDERQRALEALMAGTGCEWSAASAVRGRDIRWDKREVYANGTKNTRGRGTKWRKRWVRFTEPWAWTIFAAYARPFTGNALLFEGLTETRALLAHLATCEVLELERSTLHDWRHTYAILSLDDGIKPATVKHQLGHSPHSTELERVYAAHLPATDADYEKRTERKPAVTSAVTRRSRAT